jgi:hypothetical protein
MLPPGQFDSIRYHNGFAIGCAGNIVARGKAEARMHGFMAPPEC